MRLTIPIAVLGTLLVLSSAPQALAHESGGSGPYAATLAGFVPPVVVVPSGNEVVWTSIDVGHTMTEGGPLTGLTGPACVSLLIPVGGSAAETFTLAYSGLEAGTGEDALVCTTAERSGGVAVMRFFCAVHPAWMHGVLVVYDPGSLGPYRVPTDPAASLLLEAALGATS